MTTPAPVPESSYDREVLKLLDRVLTRPDFTSAEKSLLRFEYQAESVAMTHVWHAIRGADAALRAKFHLGFPAEVAAHEAWMRGDLKERCARLGVRL